MKRPERVAGVGKGRSRSDGKDIRRGPQQDTGTKIRAALTGWPVFLDPWDSPSDQGKAAPFRVGMVLRLSRGYWIWVITKCAETGRVPPARGVMVSAAAVPSGFRTVKTELITVVSTIAIPTIWEAPVARPTTVYSKSSPFKVKISCPASVTLTWNNT